MSYLYNKKELAFYKPKLKKLLKFSLILFFISTIFSINIINTITARPNDDNDEILTTMLGKIDSLEREIRLIKLIQSIEFESEIIIPDNFNATYVEYIYNTSTTLSVPIRTAFRLIYKESSFRESVTSTSGANGLMQLMPGTRSLYYQNLRLDTLNLDRVQEDIYIGLYMLKESHTFWKQRNNSKDYSWKLSLATYNSGIANVIKYKGIPPYKETNSFINFIQKPHSNPALVASYLKKYKN